MNVEITARHILITPAIRSYVLKRLRKFTKILGSDLSFHVIIAVEKDRHSAEILLKSKLLDLTGTSETKDMYSSIVLALENSSARRSSTRPRSSKRSVIGQK